MRTRMMSDILVWIGTGALHAQVNDTISANQLDEVVVLGNMNTTDAGGVYFIPSAKQKNTSQSGIDLLRRMTIPQIKVSLADDNVTTNTGEPVAIYINYTKASEEELEGLKTADVRKVEYFYSPSDQRFMGDRNVINIVVQPYAYGGYTKLALGETCFIGLASTASLYSKFTYRKMTYDIYVGSRNFNNKHTGTETVSKFRLPDLSTDTWITRCQVPDDTRYIQNKFPVSFRAAYSSKSFQMKNTVAYSIQDTPRNAGDGTLLFSPTVLPSETYSSERTSKLKSLSYSGNFNFNLPNQYYLTVTPKASYGHNSQGYIYSSGTSSITNSASEDTYLFSAMAMGRKIIAGVHYLFLRGFGGYTNYTVDYSGTTESTDRIKEVYGGASFQYGYYTDHLTADLLIGVRSEHNTTNSQSEKEVYPFASANFGWSPNRRHSINLSLSFSKEPMSANLKSPNVLQENELLYYCGNSGLKYSPNIMINLGYNWMPNSWLQVSPFSQFFGIYNRHVPVYAPYLDGAAILRQYVNDGNHFRTQIGFSATAKLLKGNLQLQVMPTQSFYTSTGYYDIKYNPFTFACSAIYYSGSFYYSAFYETKYRTLWSNSGTVFRDRSQLQFSAGWSNSDLNIRLGVKNPFRTSWVASTKDFVTPVYTEQSTNFSTAAHFNIALSVTYTFGYGKKVSRNNEVGDASNTSSAILK